MRYPWPWYMRPVIAVRFVIANILHARTRLCWAPLAQWALGIRRQEPVTDWSRCDLCRGSPYTWCGRAR